AMMELGATVCLAREPLCAGCPLVAECESHRLGVQKELPPRKKKVMIRREHTLLVIRRRGHILLTPSPRVSGFWELPEKVAGVRLGPKLGEFRHAITNSQYHFEVREARIGAHPKGCRWWDEKELGNIPLSTASKKALHAAAIAP
ncbi:MAG: A/G-specific adenine glycosylase, partial [Bryobacteraceae bacterium]